MKKYLFLSVGLFLIFIFLKLFVYSLPANNIRKNIAESVPLLEQEGLYPTFFSIDNQVNQERLDNWSDACLLNVAYNVGNRGLLETVAGDYCGGKGDNEIELLRYRVDMNDEVMWTYARQWFGGECVIRPLLVFFNLAEIRWLSQIISLGLIIWAVLELTKCTSKAFAFLYGFSIIVLIPSIIFSSLNLMMAFYVAIISTIAACKLFSLRSETGVFMYIVGACTAFFDLFITPVVTLGLLTLVLFVIAYHNGQLSDVKKAIFQVVVSGIAWVSGYLILWAGKWGFSSLILKQNVFLDAINDIFRYSYKGIDGLDMNKLEYILGSLKMNIIKMFPMNLLIILSETIGNLGIFILLFGAIVVLILIWLQRHRPLKECYISLVLLLISMIPFAYYVVINVHTYLHHWAEYRYQCVTFLGICTSYLYSLKECQSGKYK